jgi:hypothetical protein
MGSELRSIRNPIFQARAVGSFEQKPGCPEDSVGALGADEVARICMGECYNPSDERRAISRIEVVRIRPQDHAGEPVSPLIEDPWRSFECEPSPAGCSVTFEDPDFAPDRRDTLYYVRALEEPAPGVNASGVGCRRDAAGNCIEVALCGSGPANEECLAEHEPRAWSSPIFVDFGPERSVFD